METISSRPPMTSTPNKKRQPPATKNSKNYLCSDRGKTYKRKGSLGVHTRKHNDRGGPAFKCTFCEKQFILSAELHSHVNRRHLEQKPCKTCKKSFCNKRNTDPSRHTCKPSTNHICPTCGKDFKSASSLQDHTSKHAGISHYSCSKCWRAFMYRSQLSRHSKKCSA